MLGIILAASVYPCRAAERVALVIGNSNYEGNLALRNPANDADAVEAALKALGFSVVTKKDLDLSGMEGALVDFRRKLTKGSLGLFYYAGHGTQVSGLNYLIPIGAQLREEFEVKRKCLEVGQVLDAMAESESNLKVLVLDCCRDNPLKRGWSRGASTQGLASISNVPNGTIIAYSTAPNATADDGSGKNSPYAEQLVAALGNRPPNGLELSQVFREASRAVKRQTGQVPWLNMEASLEDCYLWTNTTAKPSPGLGRYSPGKAARSHYEREGRFSYDPPAGWNVVPFPGLKYRISHGAAEDGFAPNINVVVENYSGTLEAYVAGNMTTLQKVWPQMKVVQREPFQTDDGAPAVRLLTENEQQGRKLRQAFCFFGTGQRKYVATCTAMAKGGERFDPLFLKSMKTFRIH
jgi:hypothetical protein